MSNALNTFKKALLVTTAPFILGSCGDDDNKTDVVNGIEIEQSQWKYVGGKTVVKTLGDNDPLVLGTPGQVNIAVEIYNFNDSTVITKMYGYQGYQGYSDATLCEMKHMTSPHSQAELQEASGMLKMVSIAPK